MKWGIAFKIPVTQKSDLWTLPFPSHTEIGVKWNGMELLHVYYHFQYNPQNWKEWQRLAGIKIQIQNRVKDIEFSNYYPSNIEGKIYTISELGSHFKAFVKFPKPLFPNRRKEAYKMLCIHAKRLYYEELLQIEQLIATSIRFNEVDPEGISQVIKRAFSAYQFAQEHKDEWKVKLKKDELVNAHKKGAEKTNQIKRDKKVQNKKRAISLREQGLKLKEISKELGVSLRTVNNYLK